MKSHRILRPFGLFIYTIGVILGLIFIGLAVWAEYEAFAFDTTLTADQSLTTLNCPLAISENETATISATFHNPSQRTLRRFVRTHITEGMVSTKRQIDTILEIPPGEQKALEWTATGEDAAYDLFILARVNLMRDHPLPSQAGTCGILVVNTSILTGNQITFLVVGISIVGIGAGWRLWNAPEVAYDNRKKHTKVGMLVLAIIICAGIITVFLGWWLIGAFLLMTSLLLNVEIIVYAAILSRLE